MVSEQRLLLVVSGPSGVGKDSVVNAMAAKYPGIEVSVSATTRPPKAGEQDGVNYHYLTKQQFEQYVEDGAFIEYAVFVDEMYGTLKTEVSSRIEKGITCVLVIEVEGATNVKKIYPECTSVFILPPSLEVLEKRIRNRQRDSAEEVNRRICVAETVELPLACNYDYQIVNYDLESCADELYKILRKRQGFAE